MDTGIQLYRHYTSSGKYVCFDCRVCFHKWGQNGASKCPNCLTTLIYAGSAFRAPARRNVKEWAKLEILIRAGMKFHYCGGNGQIKGMTKKDAEEYRKRKTKTGSTIGTTPLAVRRPGNGKRVATKAWYNWDSYHLPD